MLDLGSRPAACTDGPTGRHPLSDTRRSVACRQSGSSRANRVLEVAVAMVAVEVLTAGVAASEVRLEASYSASTSLLTGDRPKPEGPSTL